MSTKALALVLPALFITFFIACDDSSGPSPSENYISGAVNLDELPGATAADINIYLVEFDYSGQTYADTTNPNFAGEYEFRAFDNGYYGVLAETRDGFSPTYFGFRDNNNDGSFDMDDALNFATIAQISKYNIPMSQFGFPPDTLEFEFESNDDPSFPQELETIHLKHISGESTSGGYDGMDYTGDRDYYRFRSVWTGDLFVELSWDSGADLDLILYDSFGGIIEASTDADPSPIILPNYTSRQVYRGDEFIVLVVSADYAAFYELSIDIK